MEVGSSWPDCGVEEGGRSLACEVASYPCEPLSWPKTDPSRQVATWGEEPWSVEAWGASCLQRGTVGTAGAVPAGKATWGT